MSRKSQKTDTDCSIPVFLEAEPKTVRFGSLGQMKLRTSLDFMERFVDCVAVQLKTRVSSQLVWVKLI